jgi:hypothetical protein
MMDGWKEFDNRNASGLYVSVDHCKPRFGTWKDKLYKKVLKLLGSSMNG